jgi:hypothetical protein
MEGSMRRLFAVDPMTGTAHYVDYDENGDTLRFIEEVNVDALIELNRQMYNEAPTGWNDGATVARLPMPLRMKLKAEGILDDPKRWAAWLNDPDNRAWRIRPGWV